MNHVVRALWAAATEYDQCTPGAPKLEKPTSAHKLSHRIDRHTGSIADGNVCPFCMILETFYQQCDRLEIRNSITLSGIIRDPTTSYIYFQPVDGGGSTFFAASLSPHTSLSVVVLGRCCRDAWGGRCDVGGCLRDVSLPLVVCVCGAPVRQIGKKVRPQRVCSCLLYFRRVHMACGEWRRWLFYCRCFLGQNTAVSCSQLDGGDKDFFKTSPSATTAAAVVVVVPRTAVVSLT